MYPEMREPQVTTLSRLQPLSKLPLALYVVQSNSLPFRLLTQWPSRRADEWVDVRATSCP